MEPHYKTCSQIQLTSKSNFYPQLIEQCCTGCLTCPIMLGCTGWMLMSSLFRLSRSTRDCVDRMSSYDWPPPDTSPSFLFRSMFISLMCKLVQSFAKVLVGWRGADPFWSDDFWVYWLTNSTANWNFGHGSWFWFCGPTGRAEFVLTVSIIGNLNKKVQHLPYQVFLCFISTLSCRCDPHLCVAGCDKGSTSVQSKIEYRFNMPLTSFTLCSHWAPRFHFTLPCLG